ncbi:MAG: AAA family ATPase [Candidatus Daviesbacteria bacterium]|nr:AAA family ATPase [Candidatus Daviesbacteria bacterium]
MDQTAQPNDNFSKLRQKIKDNNLPANLVEKLNDELDRLQKMVAATGYKFEFDKVFEYINFVASLPFNNSSQDILDLKRTEAMLNENHYGLNIVKERILEYMSILILNANKGEKLRSPILSFVGLVGSGKTSIAYSIAESMGRKIIRIPFGGLSSVTDLRGQSRVNADAEPGLLMKSIMREGVNNPVILLDEIDRVATESRADLMGVLVELLDPNQNFAFIDKYVDFPFDLSKALFIATANNTGNIATAVLDRMEMIEMPGYSDEEKIVIAKKYLMPKIIKSAGLPDNTIIIDEALWPQIVRPLGFDAGIRSLQRNIETIVRKVAKQVVEGNAGPYSLTAENVGKYIG